MSVYKPKGSPFYHFDFWWQGHRFSGSTKKASRREAEQVETAARERARLDVARANAALTSLRIGDVAARYWEEVGQYHAGAGNTLRDLNRLVDYFGAGKLLTEVFDNDVVQLVARRRGDRVIRNKRVKPAECPLISNATVNRSTVEVLRKLFTRAKQAWGVKFDREPKWRTHRLREPEERVRELAPEEAARLDNAMRADYAPFFAFARTSGLRLRECLVRWAEVNWDSGRIQKKGKGGKLVSVPITPALRAILWPLRGDHPEHVFTYVAVRTRGGRVRGQRYALTYSGVKIAWRRLRKLAGVEGFRFHDFRHDLATKLLRKTGNLKLVQRALNHADLKTTLRYAHVLDSEVAEALEQVAKSRNQSRSQGPKVA